MNGGDKEKKSRKECNKSPSPKKPQKVIVELLYTYIHYTIHMHAKYA